jgi:hypothetical protein
MAGHLRFLFPRVQPDPGDATLLLHPPGYSIIWAALYGEGASVSSAPLVRWIQVVIDGVACVIVVLIAGELFAPGIALAAGLLAALSQHLAYHSLWLSPDSLVAAPLLAAIYLIIRARTHPRLTTTISAGALIGLSCWLRANPMLLAPFLGLWLCLFSKRQRRLAHAAALVGGAALAIAPITIRNLIVFHALIPVSIDQGLVLVEGIGDYDRQGRFGLPASDLEAAVKDVEWSGRTEYGFSLWRPDGIERDRARFARGLAVVRSHPGWFLGTMVRRIGFMVRYNDTYAKDWLSASSIIPPVSASPTFGHSISATTEPAAWEAGPPALLANGIAREPDAQVLLANDGKSLLVSGGPSQYGAQFVSGPIPVLSNTDYVMRFPVKEVQGDSAIAIKTLDERVALVSTSLGIHEAEAKRKAKKSARVHGLPEPTDTEWMPFIDLPFASGNHTQVRLVLSNNRSDDSAGELPPLVRAGTARLFALGPTPYSWTGYPRRLIGGLQKRVFLTWRMVPLILAGIVILMVQRRYEAIALVLAVPIYYMVAQSALHTEYRYILPIHYFLFIFAGVSLYWIGKAPVLALRSTRTFIAGPGLKSV